MSSKSGKTIVIGVVTSEDRRRLINYIEQVTTVNCSIDFSVRRKGQNKVELYRKIGPNNAVLIKTWEVILFPISVNTSAMSSLDGEVCMHLDNVIHALELEIKKLRSLQGRQIMKGVINGTQCRELVDILYDFNE
ncbi:hypothetical protein KO465_04815 [Candidatus Micrarchaeota archaeon]|nr:hypothetical protein [Candidatus Micrarchaeota archaeon]